MRCETCGRLFLLPEICGLSHVAELWCDDETCGHDAHHLLLLPGAAVVCSQGRTVR